jgi:phenylacetate-coenzyme A ligase PaaK-like adenylate-forming protein
MSTILKEHRYILRIGYQEHILRVQEFISGPEGWRETFRIQLPASVHHEARTIYGSTEMKAVEKAASYLESPPAEHR